MMSRISAPSVVVAAVVALAGARDAHADHVRTAVVPVARVALGPAIHFTPRPNTGVEFTLDANAGAYVVFGTNGNFAADAEVGYAYDTLGTHLFDLHGGIGAGMWAFHVLYQPHLLVGMFHDERAVGMRNGIAFCAFLDMADVEVAHQFVSSAGVVMQDLHVTIGINPGAMIYAFVATLSSMN